MNQSQIDLTGSKILAVDDVPANLDVLSQSLEADGYNVLVATSGEAALDLVTRIEPDLILLDVMMPGIDGFETCRRLKATSQTANIPVIFLTARSELDGVLEGFLAGGIDYISKPFQKEEVLIRIRTHLERTFLAKELANLNAHLEQKVEERTLELNQKVRELEGKDRIAQHLLTFHSLEETLNLVLEVMADVLDIEKAMVYLKGNEGFYIAAAIGEEQPKVLVSQEKLSELKIADSIQASLDTMQEQQTVVDLQSDSPPCVLIPILSGSTLIGAIETTQASDAEKILDDRILALNSFALQAAVAIRDAQIQQDANLWKNQMDDVMNLDELSDQVEVLDQFLPNREE